MGNLGYGNTLLKVRNSPWGRKIPEREPGLLLRKNWERKPLPAPSATGQRKPQNHFRGHPGINYLQRHTGELGTLFPRRRRASDRGVSQTPNTTLSLTPGESHAFNITGAFLTWTHSPANIKILRTAQNLLRGDVSRRQIQPVVTSCGGTDFTPPECTLAFPPRRTT